MSQSLEVNDHNLEETTLASPVPVLVKFSAVWCAPCRAIASHVDALAAKYAGRVRVATCDVDENPGVTARFDVRSVPTLLIFKDGAVVGQIVGAVPRPRIEALLERALG